MLQSQDPDMGTIISFLGSSLGKYTMIAVAVMAVLAYIKILQVSVDESELARKQAENNTVLVVREFDTMYDSYQVLVSDREDDKRLYEINVKALEENHEKELADVIYITKIKGDITHVNPEDDRNISNVIRHTIDALRLYN